VRLYPGKIALKTRDWAHTYNEMNGAEFLNTGMYDIKVMIVRDASAALYTHNSTVMFEVVEAARESLWYGPWSGAVRPRLKWSTAC
jgi:hypothetical protein